MANGVHWSTLYLGNLAEMDTDESTYSVENEAPILGTFGAGQGEALSNHIVDVTSYAGNDDAVVTDNVGGKEGVRYDLGNGAVTQHIDAVLSVAGTVTFHDGSTFSGDFGVFQTPNGDTFMMVLDSQPELASQGIKSVTFTSVNSSNYSGIRQSTKDDHQFVCFGPGTRLDTPHGPIRADRLRLGDTLITLDHGPQPIRWIGKRRQRFAPDGPAPPVLIRRGAAGEDRPRRDFFLSADHRVLVETRPGFVLHDPSGALAPARALTRLRAVRPARGRRAITWYSFLLPFHAVIFAEGMAVESLYPGPEAWARLEGRERSDWMHLAAGGRVTGALPARLLLSPAEARAGLDSGLISLPAKPPRPRVWTAHPRRAPAVALLRRA